MLNQLLQSRALIPLLIALYGVVLVLLGGNSDTTNIQLVLFVAAGALVAWMLETA